MERFIGNKIKHGAAGITLATVPATAIPIDCGNVTPNFSAITMECWVKPTNTDVASRGILSNFIHSPTSHGVSIYQSSNTLKIRSGDGATVNSSANDIAIASFFTDTQWVHIVVTHDGAVTKVYRNGELVSEAAQTMVIGDYKTIIGKWASTYNDYIFEGNIDEVRVWNYARTAEQIKANYTKTLKPETGLVGYWKLDGNALDSSGNGNNGTVNGGVTWSESVAPELEKYKLASSGLNGSAEFDGIDDRIDRPDTASLNPTAAITIELWVKLSKKGSGHHSILRKELQYLINIKDSDGTIRPHVYISGVGFKVFDTTTKLTFDSWEHVAATYDGANLICYLNGVEIQRLAVTGAINTSANVLYIGSFGNIELSKGNISNARIWSVARTAEEIKQGMYQTYPAGTTGLVEQWTLNGNANGTNGNNGTVVGGTKFVADAPRRFLTSRSKQPYALKADGVTQYAKIPHNAALRPASISIALWVKYTTTGNKIIIEKGGSNNNFLIHTSATNPGRLAYRNGASTILITPAAYNDGKWHFVVCTHDSVSLTGKIYVDGVEVVSGASSNPTDDGTDWTIFARPGASTTFLDGEMDGLSFWNRAITAQEVVTLMLSGVKGNESGLLAYYEERNGILKDMLGNYDGQLINGTSIVPSTAPAGQRSMAVGLRADCGYKTAFDKTSFAVECWIRREGTQPAGSEYLITRDDGLANSWGLYLGGSAKYLGFFTRGNGTGYYGAYAVPLGRWVHAFAIVSSTTVKIYADDVLVHEIALSAPFTTSTVPLHIGQSSSGASPFSGSIANVRYWEGTVTAEEIIKNKHMYLPADTPNLIEQWGINEGVGTVVYGVKGNNGTITGATWKEPSLANWRAGHCKFDGVDDRIDCGYKEEHILIESGTLEAWVKPLNAYPGAAGTHKYRGIVAKADTGSTSRICYWIDWMGTDTTRTLRLGISDGISLENIAVDNFDFAQTWKHIAFTFDGSNLKLYVNGVLHTTKVQTIKPQAANMLMTIGTAFGNSSYGWQGNLDEVRVWNTARTQAEIQENMNRILDRHPNLVGYWRFDHDGYWDASGNGNHGTPVNGPVIEDNDNDKLNYIAPIND